MNLFQKMKKKEGLIHANEFLKTEKIDFQNSSKGVTMRLLAKYKYKKDFTVIDGTKKDQAVNLAA